MSHAFLFKLGIAFGLCVHAIAQQYTIGTVVGAPLLGTRPVQASSAAIGSPAGIATDASGNLYFTVSRLRMGGSDPAVIKVDASGMLTRVAGIPMQGFAGDGGPALNASFTDPMGLALDAERNLYVADSGNSRVRKISPVGLITTVAGNGIQRFEGDGGPAATAGLTRPRLIATDSKGNLYIAAEWGRLRKVSPDGIITTVAGDGTYGYSGDNGPAISARIGSINGLAVDVAGNVYIVDTNIVENDPVYEEYSRVRKISTDGTISTLAGGLAGYSGDDGPAEHALISSYASLSVDAAGNVFLADGPRIRRISADGAITTLAGTGVPGYSLEDGPALTTQLGFVRTITTSPAGDIYFVDGNARIRKLTPGGKIVTVAGYTTPAGVTPPMGDGGPAADAQLAAPVGVAVDEAGTVYVADTWAFRVRAIGTDGIIRTVAGTGGAGEPVGDAEAATGARVFWPSGLALDRNGALFLADAGNHRVRSVSRDGMIATVAGSGPISFAGFSGDGGRATEARLSWPKDVAIDSAGNLYIADTGNNRVRIVTPAGVISTLAGAGTATQLNLPSGLTIDGSGNLYISDTENYRVRRLSRDGVVTTVAGTGTRGHSGDNGPAIQAQLNYPTGLKFDRAGNLYIADGASIRRVTPNGTISTVAGTGVLGYSGDGGPATAATMGAWGLAFDNSGNLYVADPWNAVVRVLKPTQ